MKTAYLAPRDFLDELLGELGEQTRIQAVHGRLVVTTGPAVSAAWAQNVWFDPKELRFESVGGAARALRSIQRSWALHSVVLHRRARLIAEKLPKVGGRRLAFPASPPSSPIGSFTLLEPDLMLASANCSSPFPNGEVEFVEDREGPASRAYLKLWEALTLAGAHPKPGERCLDLGSSPGGWTWALQQLGAQVISVDKSPLADPIARLPGVSFLKRDAFTLTPGAVGPVDWLFSDVICYPQRLLELVTRWLDSGLCGKFVCTIKLQGKAPGVQDRHAIRSLGQIPGSTVRHLYHNKHELTWTLLAG
ncbi:MAG: hypothetical protein HY816_09745 [Candidatus Wallbacteria bacterium]|nr:hypothetical protein [Candidatus Wallbacteria bacterium]